MDIERAYKNKADHDWNDRKESTIDANKMYDWLWEQWEKKRQERLIETGEDERMILLTEMNTIHDIIDYVVQERETRHG